jgi:hypothetical protein
MSEETDSGVAVGSERKPVLRIYIKDADHNDKENYEQFDRHHGCIEAGALPDPFDKNSGDYQRDQNRRYIEIGAGRKEILSNQSEGTLLNRRNFDAEAFSKIFGGQTTCGRGRSYGVFKDEIPPDDHE